jgi:large conductance mechanosensitive channel
MGLLKEFKEFAMKGSVVDLAVGVIIGASFGTIVQSLVKDVIMPPIGLLTGGVDFSNKVIELKHPLLDSAGKVVKEGIDLRYGIFINAVINFLIVAVAIFFVVKLMNAAHRKPISTAAPTTKECPLCTSAIPLNAKKCPLCTADLPVAI